MNYNKLKTTELTLEKAKKLSKIYDRPLQNHVILMNAVAPMVTEGGIILGNDAHKAQQQEANKLGMLVVNSPFKLSPDGAKDLSNINAVYEGEHVLFQKDSPAAFVTTITSEDLVEGLKLDGKEVTKEMYQKYVIICISAHYLTCTVIKE